jgi:hypothetical protein
MALCGFLSEDSRQRHTKRNKPKERPRDFARIGRQVISICAASVETGEAAAFTVPGSEEP